MFGLIDIPRSYKWLSVIQLGWNRLIRPEAVPTALLRHLHHILSELSLSIPNFCLQA